MFLATPTTSRAAAAAAAVARAVAVQRRTDAADAVRRPGSVVQRKFRLEFASSSSSFSSYFSVMNRLVVRNSED